MIDINVADILPHDGAMVLLDNVLEYDQQSLVAAVTVRNDGMFGDGKTIPAWIGIEYMAQTVAAHGGMMCHLAGKPINLGFLLGTRRYTCNISEFTVGMHLTVKVERLIEDQGLGVFTCQILGDGIDISAKLNVYQPDKVENKIIK
ncbi:MAG: 3-hydroxylacyl-ACP dehydratase [Methylomarinum sp.]|nr:3-hydroxylacyl-ACP dehydratase [Methylomarinum sp.]